MNMVNVTQLLVSANNYSFKLHFSSKQFIADVKFTFLISNYDLCGIDHNWIPQFPSRVVMHLSRPLACFWRSKSSFQNIITESKMRCIISIKRIVSVRLCQLRAFHFALSFARFLFCFVNCTLFITQLSHSTSVCCRLVRPSSQTAEFYKRRAKVWQHFHSEHSCDRLEYFHSEVEFFRSESVFHPKSYRDLGMFEAVKAGRSEHYLVLDQQKAVFWKLDFCE